MRSAPETVILKREYDYDYFAEYYGVQKKGNFDVVVKTDSSIEKNKLYHFNVTLLCHKQKCIKMTATVVVRKSWNRFQSLSVQRKSHRRSHVKTNNNLIFSTQVHVL